MCVCVHWAGAIETLQGATIPRTSELTEEWRSVDWEVRDVLSKVMEGGGRGWEKWRRRNVVMIQKGRGRMLEMMGGELRCLQGMEHEGGGEYVRD